MKKFTTLFFSFLLLIFGSCSGFDRINEALELKNKIAEKYDSEEVEVQITNTKDISISLIDKELSGLTRQEQKEITAEIEKMILEMQPEGFESGQVVFVNKADAGVISKSSSEVFDLF